jgi:hypothetical protein
MLAKRRTAIEHSTPSPSAEASVEICGTSIYGLIRIVFLN